jgi:hypothetical protein
MNRIDKKHNRFYNIYMPDDIPAAERRTQLLKNAASGTAKTVKQTQRLLCQTYRLTRSVTSIVNYTIEAVTALIPGRRN